jgi:signal transduction histidine kinase
MKNDEVIIEGIASDITERKKAAEEIQYQKEFEKMIFAAEPNIVVVNDGDQIVYANPVFFKFFNEYNSLEEFFKEHLCICELFEKTDQEGYIYEGKDGKSWIQYIAENPRDYYRVLIKHGGKDHHFILIFEQKEIRNTMRYIINLTDVTELEEYRTYLEQKVSREVEKRLQGEKMIVYQSKLAAMGDLTSRIAHHWRQPLSAFSLTLENMRESIASGEVDKHNYEEVIDTLIAQVHSMSDLISKFHHYLRTDTDIQPFSIKDRIKETAVFFQDSVSDDKYNLILNINADKELIGIPRDFGYAILSILNNSKDVMELRDVRNPLIEISVERQSDQHIQIIIQDNGGGIDQDILDRIFEPYFTTKFPTVGTGMGLYVSRTIIEDHFGGHISVENSSNGARFLIIL